MSFEYDEIIFAEMTNAENPVSNENQRTKQILLDTYYLMFNNYKL